jgi:invasion protein IalB
MRIVLSALVLGLATGQASAELASTDYGDWSVACNTKNYCIAETDGDASNGEAFRLKIERSAKAGGEVYVTFDPTTELSAGLSARIEIESLEEDNYGFFGKVAKVYKGNEMTFGGAADRDLMEKLRMGEDAAIQIEFGGATGTLTYEVSLKGITHALLRIDTEQGRVGRTDAIVAWGGLPSDESTGIAAPTVVAAPAAPPPAPDAASDTASAAPVDDLPPPIMPSQETSNSGIDRGAQGQVYALHEIPDEIQMMGFRTLDCQLEETVPAFGAQYFAEGDVETWIVPCQMADANVPFYMATHIPFNPSLDEWKEFETPPGFNQPNHALVNNLFYDPSTGQVTGTTYYSPNYDCGTFERHEVEAESGNYMLVEYLEKGNCDGVTGPPEGWPLSWTIDEMGD